ncbi:MAG: hypothetical protein VX628_08215 [Cyanobacteriota bacterium]|nr:hypothetical protein [Cyanobacteriota bacterium]
MNTSLTPELREQLLVALTNQWAAMAEAMDEGDFTPEDFYAIQQTQSDASLISESGCNTDDELNQFINDWFYSGFWIAP